MRDSKMTQSSALYDFLVHSVDSLQLTTSDSVGLWLEDLRLMTETECMCVLQGKSLHNDTTDVVFTTATNIKDRIDSIRGRAHVISAEFSKLFRKLDKERWKHVKTGSLRLTCQIRALLHECNKSVTNPSRNFSELQLCIMEECAKLAQHVESHLEPNGHKPFKAPVLKLLTLLGQSFSTLVDITLGNLIKKMLLRLKEVESTYSVNMTINQLISLGLDGEHMCYIIAREGGIGLLFNVCRQPALQSAHAAALRCVATICCVRESVLEVQKQNGVACLSTILGDPSTAETTRAEAAGVVAQMMSPLLEQYQQLAAFLEHMEDLVQSITGLCHTASSPDVFLLGTAALANLTFMDTLACDFLVRYLTAKVLIEACILNKHYNLFIKDQVATVLANLSSLDACCASVSDHHGIELLVQFLYESLSDYKNDAQQAACERVLQKSAIALSRLGREPHCAQLIVEMQGIPRLVQLCKEPEERNHSEPVLVACLAALRKISTACGLGGFAYEDVQSLIQPKMVQTYVRRSSLNESIV